MSRGQKDAVMKGAQRSISVGTRSSNNHRKLFALYILHAKT